MYNYPLDREPLVTVSIIQGRGVAQQLKLIGGIGRKRQGGQVSGRAIGCLLFTRTTILRIAVN